MKVYVLVGGVYYEGRTILGIYSSEKLAENAKSEWEEPEGEAFHMPYDYYKIGEYEVTDEL